jgi:hypothetical protein
VKAVEQAGIVEPVRVGARVQYAGADVELAREALRLLSEGLPLADLLALAIHHADRSIESSTAPSGCSTATYGGGREGRAPPTSWRRSSACCRR